MPIVIDKQKALEVLAREAALAMAEPLPDEHEWVARVRHLSELCDAGAPRTHIAMLGTALLAKATDARVDVFALKTGVGTPGAYSARGLAQHVLAANAPRLRIDLGVTGPEPLNNQPYFGKARVGPELRRVVRADGLRAFDYVVECLERLKDLSSEQAALALRAFIQARTRQLARVELAPGEYLIHEDELQDEIERFVGGRSEGGRRAQAVVAGLLDVQHGSECVRVERVNDPDRRFPGDVAVVSQAARVERAFEVRDKVVTENDIYHFIDKVAGRTSRAAVVAVAAGQAAPSLKEVKRYAIDRGVALTFYMGWGRLLSDVLFFSRDDPAALGAQACARILERLQELEVSDAGVRAWVEAIARIRATA